MTSFRVTLLKLVDRSKPKPVNLAEVSFSLVLMLLAIWRIYEYYRKVRSSSSSLKMITNFRFEFVNFTFAGVSFSADIAVRVVRMETMRRL